MLRLSKKFIKTALSIMLLLTKAVVESVVCFVVCFYKEASADFEELGYSGFDNYSRSKSDD